MNINIDSTMSSVLDILHLDIPITATSSGIYPAIGHRGVWNHLIKNEVINCFTILQNSAEQISSENNVLIAKTILDLHMSLKDCFDSFKTNKNTDLYLNESIVHVNELKNIAFTYVSSLSSYNFT